MALKRKPGIPDLVKEYRNEISLARKKFRTEQPQSSAGSKKSDFCQIIFYESFEHYPITLEGGYKIYPKRWALAFLKQDIKSIAEILCESLFTEAELQKRNENGTTTLPNTKKLAIQRAAKWLTNKNQDPWSYKAGPWPTQEEKRSIEEAFQTFNWTDPKSIYNRAESNPEKKEDARMEICESSETSSSTPAKDENEDKNKEKMDWITLEVVGQPNDDTVKEQVSVENSTSTEDTGYDEILQDLSIDCEYYTAFENAIKLGRSGQCTSLGNTAQTAKLLTNMVIPENEDIFVDAVQFSNGRWAAAVDGDTVEDIIEPLFRKYYKVEFERRNKLFTSLDDFCPIKVLALLRAVAWIKQLKTGSFDDSFGFDSSIPEHNLFPTISETYKIYNYLSRKYGNGPCRPESSEPEPMMSEGTPPSTPPPTTTEAVVRSTCIVSPTPVAVEVEVVATQSKSSPMQTLQPTLQSPSLDGQGNATIPGCNFTATVWREALRRFRLEEKNGAEKAGKFLFEEAFTSKEILDQNISGRHGKEKFSEVKMNEIFKALEEMKGVISGQGAMPWTKSETKELTTKIFIEHSNYLRRKLKEAEKIAARVASSSNRTT